MYIFFILGGGWERIAERRGRRGSSTAGVETFPKVPTEELAVDRPSFCLKYGPLFFPFLIGCMTSRCYFCLM